MAGSLQQVSSSLFNASQSANDLKNRLAEAEQQAKDTAAALKALDSQMAETKRSAAETKSEISSVEGGAHELGNALVEAVKLSGDASASLQGTSVQLYELQKAVTTTEKVSRDTLDQIEKLVEAKVPGMRIWLSNFIQQAADGKLSLAELLKKIDDFNNDPGVAQMSGAMPGYMGNVREFAQLWNALKQSILDANDAAAKAAGGGAHG